MTRPPHRLAAFDIGSNSVKLLVAEVGPKDRFRVLLEQTAITRIGEGLRKDFRMHEAAMERTLAALAAFKRQCGQLGVQQYRAIATSALRDATNHPSFAKRFHDRLGLRYEVVTGDREAALIYRGATSDPRLVGKSRRIVVMDAGGGSAEWIRGTGHTVKRRLSLNLGCVRMTEGFLRGDPYTRESYAKLLTFYRQKLAPLRRRFAIRDGRFIATGGSITTAAAALLDLPDCNSTAVHGCALSIESLESWLERLRRMTQAQRVSLKAMEPQRADIIVAGVALFVVAMQILGARELRVSTRALRYGALLMP